MTRRVRKRVYVTILTSGVIALESSPAAAACPSASDLLYTIRHGDTLSRIAATEYAYNDPAGNRIVWELLYSYNRNNVGAKPDEIPTGTGICLPARLQYDKIVATRRGTFREGGEPTVAKSPGAISDHATAPNLGADKTPATDSEPVSPPAPPPASATPIAIAPSLPSPSRQKRRRASIEAGAGMLAPSSSYTYKHLFRELGTGFVGARVSTGAIEFAPRVLFAYGNHGTVYNDAEQHQSALGIGGALHVGIPFDVASFRFSPGAAVNLLHVERSFTHADFPLKGQEMKQSGLLPLLGVAARAEWTPHPALSSAPERLGIAAEGGGDIMMMAPSEYDFANSIVMRFNLSVTYRIR